MSERVGRFVPHHFSVALNTPEFTTGCNAGGFTYAGQTFGYSTAPVITATALAAGGTITQNYTGAFFKLATATLANRTYSAAAGTLDTSALPTTAVDPVVAEIGGGNATLTFGGGAGLSFAKTSPIAPFSAGIQLSIDVLDADGVAASGSAPLTNPVTFGSPSGIAFDAGQEIRYGRIRIANALGSERVDLPVRMLAEHYASSSAGFVTNTADTCTTNVSLAFAGFTENLAPGETCVRDGGAPGASGSGCPAAAPLGLRYARAAGRRRLQSAARGARHRQHRERADQRDGAGVAAVRLEHEHAGRRKPERARRRSACSAANRARSTCARSTDARAICVASLSLRRADGTSR